MTNPTVAESPLPTVERPQPRTTGDAAALACRRRVQIIDRIARTAISVSGLAIICAVLGIGLLLFLEILPLVRGARLQQGAAQQVLSDGQPALLVLADEHLERAAVLGREPVLRIVSLGTRAPAELIPVPGLEGHRISAVSRALHEPRLALATDLGVVWIGAIQLQTVFEGGERRIRVSVEPEAMVEAVPGHQIVQAAYRHAATRGIIASVVDDASLIVTRLTTHQPLIGPVHRAQESVRIPLDGLGRPTGVLLNEAGTQLLVGTSAGLIARWRLPDGEPADLLETVQAVPAGAVTAMTYLLGNRSVVVGGSDGSVATWSLVPVESHADGWRLTRIHPFPGHAAAVTSLAASPRDKGFITISADGMARLHYMTSERTLGAFSIGAAPAAADFAPKANAALVMDQTGVLHDERISNLHPEISWRTLFGKIWYEGYSRPEYIWQSTGGTDDFESKFSLVPLIFGTLKGTCYALLFAVPLALFGALYCSQFLEKRLRNPIKSTIELMAALPSVVLGFVTGIVLAPFVQGHLVSVLITPVLIPAVSVGGLWLCRLVPSPSVKTCVRRQEFWILTVWAAVGVAASAWMGPWIERAVFGGDLQAWLLQAAGVQYDQRNALVVGWAMGFAVIPIIFTICEDAFSAVPQRLVGASFACGASAWQTAWRIVLPAAGSGVFSAVMVGFGRAVGETMIVLMATGNTPIMDWTIFNGFRALSANIAVEIPEAPYQGTLYRVLFVAALLLFAMTFAVNTAAELVRLRLRRQLQGL